MVLFITFVQIKFRPCKLNLDRTVYTVFRNIRYTSKISNVLNTVFSKQNISCFEIRWPRPIWWVNVFFMHSASAVDKYRAQRKDINYSIWPMRISRHDLRRRYSNSLVIDAGSQFSLRACSQANHGPDMGLYGPPNCQPIKIENFEKPYNKLTYWTVYEKMVSRNFSSVSCT
jgi:hypothetical protein